MNFLGFLSVFLLSSVVRADFQDNFISIIGDNIACSAAFVDLSPAQDASLIGLITAHHCMPSSNGGIYWENGDVFHGNNLSAKDAKILPQDGLVWIVSPEIQANSGKKLLKVAATLPEQNSAGSDVGNSYEFGAENLACSYQGETVSRIAFGEPDAHPDAVRIYSLLFCANAPASLNGMSGGPALNASGEYMGINHEVLSVTFHSKIAMEFTPITQNDLTGDPKNPIRYHSGLTTILNFSRLEQDDEAEGISKQGIAWACTDANGYLIGQLSFQSLKKNESELFSFDPITGGIANFKSGP